MGYYIPNTDVLVKCPLCYKTDLCHYEDDDTDNTTEPDMPGFYEYGNNYACKGCGTVISTYKLLRDSRCRHV